MISFDKDNFWIFFRYFEMVEFRDGWQFFEESFKEICLVVEGDWYVSIIDELGYVVVIF